MANQKVKVLSGLRWNMAVLLLPWISLVAASGAHAQAPIVPAQDGLNTQVIQQGDRSLIQGGQLSGDQTNLFHGFSRFNVPTGHTADFQASPQLRNILGRISGGEPSFIDGTIQVSGGTPNLFLLNPAGAVFGPNSQLNVPASFHFSTANQVQFGSEFGLNIFGVGDSSGAVISALSGDPTGFFFDDPASLVNFGILAVMPGADLTLIGGTVLNVGTLAAPGGTVTLAAVEGGFVSVGTADGVLSLELQSEAIAPTGNIDGSFSPLRLPELLTGSNFATAAGVAINGETGAVTLGRTIVTAEGGTAIASGSLDASSPAGNGGTVNVLGDRVAVAAGNITATGANVGGLVQVGGGFQGNGAVWNAQNTSVDPLSVIDVSATEFGDGGTGIAWADGNTWFEGTAIATGGPLGGNGGLIETSGLAFLDASAATIDASAPFGQPGTWLLDPPDLAVVAGGPGPGVDLGSTGTNPIEYSPNAAPIIGTSQITDGTIEQNLNAGTSVTLTATEDITVQAPIDASPTGNTTLRLEAGSDITVSQNITFSAMDNAVELVAGGNININADIVADMTGTVDVQAETTGASATVALLTGRNLDTNGGDVTLASTMGGVELQTISSISTNGGEFSVNADVDFSMVGASVNTAGGGVEVLTRSGIVVSASTLQAGVGNVVLNGDRDNAGGGQVLMESASLVQTTTGTIDIDGEGLAGGGTQGAGVTVDASTVRAGTGQITIDGTGGPNFTGTATGVELLGGAVVEGGGAIAITGTGDTSGSDTASTNLGVSIDGNSQVTATGTGLTTIQGTAGTIATDTHVGRGVFIGSGSTVSVGDGGLTVTGEGTGTGANFGHGMLVDGAITATGNGNVTLTGLGAMTAGNNNHGVFMGLGTVQVVSGAALLTGTARGTGTNNSGVVLVAVTGGTVPTVQATGTGSVTLEGQRGNGNSDNNDVFMGGLAAVQGGTLTLRSLNAVPTTPTADGNDGVVVTGQFGLVRSGGGAIAITGSAAPGMDGNRGIAIENSAGANTGISAQNGGTVTLTGTSAGTGMNNIGVEIGGNVTTNNGTTVTVVGSSTAAPVGTFSVDGVLSLPTAAIASAAGTGSFTFTGTGSSAGVKLQSSVSTVNGDITITGTGGEDGIRIENTVETTGAGSLRATGTATGPNGNGISIDNGVGDYARATGTGGAIFDATGTGTGLDFDVALAGASTNAAANAAANTGLFSLTTARNLDFPSDRTFTGNVFLRSRTGNVTLQDLISTQGSLAVVSDQGNITYDDLNAATTIDLTATQGFITGTSILAGGNTQVRANGEVVVTGTIVSGGYDARSESDRFQSTTVMGPGPISIFANLDLVVGNITNPGNSIRIESATGQITAGDLSTTAATGGAITVMAQTQITSGFLNSRGTVGAGGNVFVDPTGDVIIPWIDASGSGGSTGGTIFVETTAGDLRFTGLVPNVGCAGSSVCTTSGSRVDLRHGGATAGGAPTFETGDPSVNGSAGTLTNGVNTIPTGLSLLSTPATSFVDGGVSVTPGEILTTTTPLPPPPVITTPPEETPDPTLETPTTDPVPETHPVKETPQERKTTTVEKKKKEREAKKVKKKEREGEGGG
ncbi:MAG: beta strand repeat-containing protein, partial [Cyanophyceae cyanobacterium]